MCYAKPGPRCHGHAVERKDNIAAKTAKAFREAENASSVAHTLENANLAGYKDDPKWQKAYRAAEEKRIKYRELSDKLDGATKDIDYTRGGIQNLKDSIADCQPEKGVDEQMRLAHLQQRLKSAEKVYNEQMLAYDAEHGTVNGRQGSPYGSEKGIKMLRQKLSSVEAKLDVSYDSNDSDGFMKYGRQQKELKAQLEHAVATKSRVDAGIADESRASLAEAKDELKRVTNAYNRVEKIRTKKQKELQDGPMKAYQDYRRELSISGVSPSRWRVGQKKKLAELEDKMLTFRKEHVNPFTQKSNELYNKKGKLESRVIWAEASDEKRAKMLKNYRDIQADYGKGPGSWTGD